MGAQHLCWRSSVVRGRRYGCYRYRAGTAGRGLCLPSLRTRGLLGVLRIHLMWRAQVYELSAAGVVTWQTAWSQCVEPS